MTKIETDMIFCTSHPIKEQIINDKAANKMLARPIHGPWHV
ncbi:MAG: hypothetical protein ACYSSI_06995 [Planctomycetota bacterium]|jgi:hypothetical protein